MYHHIYNKTLHPRDGFCPYPGFRTLAEIAGALSMLISSTLSLWKPYAKDARIPDTSKYSQFFSRSRCNCTHTCMILFYDRFDKTAIQIQLLKDQLQLTLVRRPAEQVGKGSCKSRSSKVEGNFEITWNGEKIIFACLFEFCSFIIMIDHDNVSRSQLCHSLFKQRYMNFLRLPTFANKTQTSNLRGENFAGSNLGGFRRCSWSVSGLLIVIEFTGQHSDYGPIFSHLGPN